MLVFPWIFGIAGTVPYRPAAVTTERLVPSASAPCVSGDVRIRDGPWLRLAERCVRDAEDAGSNPVGPRKDKSSTRAESG